MVYHSYSLFSLGGMVYQSNHRVFGWLRCPLAVMYDNDHNGDEENMNTDEIHIIYIYRL